MEVSGHVHALANLFLGKSPQYPLDRRLGGAQGWYGHNGKEKKISSLLLVGTESCHPI